MAVVLVGSLYAFTRCNLRNKDDSQEETRMITQLKTSKAFSN